MDWRLKALAFRALELPGGAAAHYHLQRRVVGSWPRPEKALKALQERARQVMADYARHVGGTPRTILEVGAGRDLAVPLALRGLGVEKVTASDVTRLARLDLVQHAMQRIAHAWIGSWQDLADFGVLYRAPHRVSENDERVDCSCSNEVLEHVPTDELVTLLKALRSVTAGLTVHSIDYSDHYARSDGSLSRFNFLRYSDEEWKRYNPPMQYVNRLRHSDYVRLFRDAGFSIVEERSEAGPVPDFKVAPQFQRYEAADLFALRGRIVAV